MRRLLFTLIFFGLSSAVQAQTHYCDTTQTVNSGSAVVGATVTVQACHDGKDSTGTVNVTPTGWRLYDNNVGASIAMTKGTTSTVSGRSLYSGSYVVPSTPGVHTLQATALVGTTESPTRSNTFTLTGVAAVPSAPTNLSIP